MEEKAEDYLAEFVDRSMLQVVRRNVFGRLKAFGMHDVVREFRFPKSSLNQFQNVEGVGAGKCSNLPNQVSEYGCCVNEENRILVYEYLENGSLDQVIFGKRDLHLDWPKRFNILLGVAKGLAYLHEESSVRIVHRDVKASNILLGADLYDDKISHISTKVAGTIGYLAPEYALRGHLTEKADVFAFGVLALEVVSGRPNSNRLDHETVYLLEWAWNLLENNQKIEAVDRSLTSFDEEEVNRVIGVALLCTQASPVHRPPMSRVVAMLVGDLEIMDVTERPSYLLLWQCAENSDASY